eukprot:GILI01001008.1.p2 GENE.GILI01001008.1~~GILI01001008.1.p2  ORF type:complete len:118 (+),score=37.28 GILI01001008.1:91-444(+)
MLRAISKTRFVLPSSTSRLPFVLSQRFFADNAGTYLDAKEVEERVLNVLKRTQKVEPSKVSASAHFANDLGLDSLDSVEVVMAFEDEFAIEIPDADAEKIVSAADAIKYISSNPYAK